MFPIQTAACVTVEGEPGWDTRWQNTRRVSIDTQEKRALKDHTPCQRQEHATTENARGKCNGGRAACREGGRSTRRPRVLASVASRAGVLQDRCCKAHTFSGDLVRAPWRPVTGAAAGTAHVLVDTLVWAHTRGARSDRSWLEGHAGWHVLLPRLGKRCPWQTSLLGAGSHCRRAGVHGAVDSTKPRDVQREVSQRGVGMSASCIVFRVSRRQGVGDLLQDNGRACGALSANAAARCASCGFSSSLWYPYSGQLDRPCA